MLGRGKRGGRPCAVFMATRHGVRRIGRVRVRAARGTQTNHIAIATLMYVRSAAGMQDTAGRVRLPVGRDALRSSADATEL